MVVTAYLISLGHRFPSHWLGGRLKIAPSFHLEARDIITAGSLDSADSADAVRFYLSQVCLLCNAAVSSPTCSLPEGVDAAALRDSECFSGGQVGRNIDERDMQISAGVLVRIEVAERFLRVMASKNEPFVTHSMKEDMQDVRRECSRQAATASTSSIVPVLASHSNDHSLSRPRNDGASSTSTSGGCGDMDKLRILSRAAFDFL